MHNRKRQLAARKGFDMNTMPVLLLYLWDYAIIIPAALLCIMPVLPHCRMKPQRFLPIMSVTLLALSFLLAFIRYSTEINANIPLVCALIPIFLLYMVLFDVKKIKLMYIFLTAIALFSFGGVSTHYIEAIIDSDMEIIIAYSVKWAVSLLFLGAEFIFLKKLRWLLDNRHVNIIWKFIWIVPVLITVFNFILIPSDYANVRVGRAFPLYIMYEITLIIFFMIILFMQYAIARAITNAAEAEHNAHLLEMQASQYDTMKKYLENTARVRHDLLYVVKTASSLAAGGETEQLQKLLNDYSDSIEASSAPLHYCENTALNAIAAHFVSEAQQKGIQITVRLNVSQNILISDYEICSIVGNILDNAVAAAESIQEITPEILLVAETKPNGDLYIAVSNSYDGSVIEKSGKFISTKNGGHGIGLESVRAIVRKNNGYCNFRYDDKKFYSEIMLRQP